MKRIILTLVLAIAALTASANEIRYFTNSQARRVATMLDAQDEVMIYCGYEYELATYVIVNEVWAEAVNSKYYEIWLYGYDAYTGEEIYMPIDLSCIWLYNRHGNKMYSAAQYLRFRGPVATPNFYWTMPPYNPFVRHFHDPYFNRHFTYHYHVHRHGWHPGMIPPGGPHHYHPYYTRTPNTPAPVPSKPFTPGVNYPLTNGHEYVGTGNNATTSMRGTSLNSRNGGARSGNNSNNAGNAGTTSRNSTTTSGTTSRGASTDRGTSTRGSNTNTGTTTRETSTDRGTSTRSSNTNTGTTTRGTSTDRGTSTRSSNTNTGTTTRGTSTDRGTSTRSSNANTGTTTRSTTTTRGVNSRSNSDENTNTRGTSSRNTSGNSGRNSR